MQKDNTEKVWGGQIKHITVCTKYDKEEKASFNADDIYESYPRMFFFLNGKQTGYYNMLECWHKETNAV